MTRIVLGPMLRWVEDTSATVWVELDAPATVVVTAGPARGEARSTAVAGRHYALVVVEGLVPATTTPYEVTVDDDVAWPEPGSRFPPSAIRTPDPERPVQVVFGSCRLEAPLGGDWDNPPDDPRPGHGVDALEALAETLASDDPAAWPDLLALLGDQLYADLVVHDPPVHDGPDAPPPGTLADLDDYVELYHRTWGHPSIRWLLSTVPTAMVFDDHDVVDDWNLSAEWIEEVSCEPWWAARISGGLVSYWLYQHWGNLSPAQLAEDPVALAVTGADDASRLLHELAATWPLDPGRPTPPDAVRWSTSRDIRGRGSARLVLVDARNRRHLVEGSRAVLDADEMAWVAERARVDRDGVDHLLLGSSLPWLLPHGVHHLERWGEALGGGRWGRVGRRLATRIRADLDLEHWPSFGRSFDDLADLLRSTARGEQGPSPRSVLVLSGDVHFSYVARLEPEPGAAPVVQLVSSPFRHGVGARLRRMLLLITSRAGRWGGALGRTTARGQRDAVRWSVTAEPWFGNGLAQLRLDEHAAQVRFARSVRRPDGRAALETVHEETVAPDVGGV